MFRLDCIVVCVDFDDYLTHTLPRLLPHCDDLVVYTSPEDVRTQALCLRNDVRCVKGDQHKTGGGKLNKAAAINHALLHLQRSDWILTQDADIAVPVDFRRQLERADLQHDSIYGVDRVDCHSLPEWRCYQQGVGQTAAPSVIVAPPFGWKVAPRLAHPEYGGWCPLGYFQLWHSRVASTYTLSPGADAEHSDLLHACQWPLRCRRLLQGWYAIHLEGQGKEMGADWHGRKTQRFEENPWHHVKAAVRSGRAPSVAAAPGAQDPSGGTDGAEQR